MKQIRMIGSALALIAGLGGASSALANLVSFDIKWEGYGTLSGASATGFITFDDTVLPKVGSSNPPGLAGVNNLEVTITGASSGSGTFHLSDFDDVAFWAPDALDLAMELIGQSLPTTSCTFGNISCTNEEDGGDFNVFGIGGSGAPEGVWYFTLMPDGYSCPEGAACGLQVTSMTPGELRAIPEPATLALFGLGLAAIGALRRKKQVA